MIYRKLVRDKIPEIIGRRGDKPVIQVLDTDSYGFELKRKLQEEVREFVESGRVEELVDILEVVYSLASIEGVGQSKLEAMRRKKRKERGSFDKRILLVRTTMGESRLRKRKNQRKTRA
jgi:predicted house-cleaning noncanonical NTP pyrophosphatase (MazG superfamily)